MRIVVLAGPPCSGKTTLAHHMAQPDDQVLDFDDIARSIGSPVEWVHPEPYRTWAEHQMQERIQQVHDLRADGTAWVIRTAPRAAQRAELAHAWGAHVYLLNPGEGVCRSRAVARPSGTRRQIGMWYHRYRAWSGDRDPSTLVPGAGWCDAMPRPGGTTARGYGHDHQRMRARLLRDMSDGDPCCRCGEPMYREQDLDADHYSQPRAFGGELPDALAHRSCNRSHGASMGNRMRKNPEPRWLTGEDP